MQGQTLEPGSFVESYDGHRVGILTGVSDGRLLLSPRSGKPYWLDDVHIRSVDSSVVRLHLERRTLARYQPAPAHRIQPRHIGRGRIFLATTSLAGMFATALITMLAW